MAPVLRKRMTVREVMDLMGKPLDAPHDPKTSDEPLPLADAVQVAVLVADAIEAAEKFERTLEAVAAVMREDWTPDVARSAATHYD